MNGIELSRGYYEEYGKEMLTSGFAGLLPYIAVGICGQGSECFGYDDDVSRDHDFEPGFIIFLPGEDKIGRRQEFLLEKAYLKLPKEYKGVRRQTVAPVGGPRHGVKRTADFFLSTVGSPDGELTLTQWLKVPDHALSEALNGKIFEDNYGEVTKIRDKLSEMPEDICKKRLAGRLIIMAQAGQYNYSRCLAHGETAAAQLALFEFTHKAMEAVFLLNRRPMPFYKWAFRAMRELKTLNELAGTFEFLISSDNSAGNVPVKKDAVDRICGLLAKEIEKQGIAKADSELERLAYTVNDNIKDANLRSLSIFCTV